jgi:hypothetical protein
MNATKGSSIDSRITRRIGVVATRAMTRLKAIDNLKNYRSGSNSYVETAAARNSAGRGSPGGERWARSSAHAGRM